MKSIDADVLAGYNRGVERGRLKRGLGLVEEARTRELLCQLLPPPPAVVYDIGGGYGEYAWFLADKGYQVHLFDLAQGNIAMSGELAADYPGRALAAAQVCDARSVPRADGSCDALLMMGPLYHIVDPAERAAALAEARRLLRPGGRLFAAAITRYATALWAATVFGRDNELLSEAAFCKMVAHELATGDHIRPADSAYHGMGRSYFHLPGEFCAELEAAGFGAVDLRGVVGPGWLAPCLDDRWDDPAYREGVLRLVRLLEKEDSLMGLSTHLLAICEKRA